MSQSFYNHFGVVDVAAPAVKGKNCVADSQCTASDLCFEGKCTAYFIAQESLAKKQAIHMRIKEQRASL